MPLVQVHISTERMNALARVVVGEIMRRGSVEKIQELEEDDIFAGTIDGHKAHIKWSSIYSTVASILNGNRKDSLDERVRSEIVRFLILEDQEAISSASVNLVTDLVLFGSPQRRSESV